MFSAAATSGVGTYSWYGLLNIMWRKFSAYLRSGRG